MRMIGIALTLAFFLPFSSLLAQQDLEELKQEMIQEIEREFNKAKEKAIEEVEKKLTEYKKQRYGYLGVELKNLDKDMRFLLDLPENQGVLVKSVYPNSPAAKAGLKKMDVILQFDQQPVAQVAKLQALIEQHRSQETVSLVILRKRDKQEISVQLATKYQKPSSPANILEQMLQKQLSPQFEEKLDKLFRDLPKFQEEALKNVEKELYKHLQTLKNHPEIQEKIKELDQTLEKLRSKEFDLKELEELLRKQGKGEWQDLLEKLLPENPKQKQQQQEDMDSFLQETDPNQTKADSFSFCGVKIISLPDYVREKEGFFYEHGVLVSSVEQDSVGAQAGIHKWDIITEVAGQQVFFLLQVKDIIENQQGKEIELEIFSKGKFKKVVLPLK